MSNPDRTRCLILKYRPGQGPDFDWLVTLTQRRALAIQHYTNNLVRHYPHCFLVDIDGARVMVALADGAEHGDVAIAVGRSADETATDRLRGQRASFCKLLAKAIEAQAPAEAVLQSHATGIPDQQLAKVLLDAAASYVAPARTTPAQAAEGVPLDRMRAAIYAPVAANDPAPVGHRSGFSLPMRAAIGTMTSVVTIASFPVGVVLLAANARHGPSLRWTAAAMVGVAWAQAYFGLSTFPMV